ncbi:MAG: mechanosensitive ion channel [Proteobacteria bacterium]|nr:mechanosensitive ion channel [Pseudomonadota bacterium]
MRVAPPLLILALLCTILLAAAPPVQAAGNPLAAFTAKTTAKPATPPATLDAAQIDAAITTLNNPAERNALIATLEAMKHPATKPTATTTTATTTTATTSPNTGIGFVQEAETKARLILGDVGSALKAATDIRLVWHWMVFVATDTWLRQTVIHAVTRLAMVLATALAGEYLVIYLLRRPRAAILRRAARLRDSRHAEDEAGLAAAEAGESEKRPRRRSLRRWFRRLPLAIAHVLLALAPILIFALIGFLWLTGSLANERVAKLVVIAVLNAYLACRLTLEVARFLLAPGLRDIRLIRTTDRRAEWLVNWLRRIIGVIAFGYAAIATGGLFGLYHAASQVLIKLVSLIVHIMAAIMVLQARRPVAAIIRGDRHADHTRSGVITAARAGLARSWHILALFYIIALWIAWAIGVPHAFFIMLRIVLVFAIIAALARSISAWMAHGLESAFDDEVTWRTQYPSLFTRLRLYVPVVKLVISIVLGTLAILVILQLWGIGVLAWFTVTRIGQRIVSAVITIGLAALIGLIAWETINAALEAQAERLVQQGRPGRAARYRTLLPMLRTTLLVIILVIVALVVLSAVGVNVTLLLGGLSIFGLAIGFGSQKLVQDIITGLFLLLEDAMQVGDTVTLGGMSGVVEKLSIRTIRLRGGDGSLNIIPFSSVTTVTNSSRDFGYAPINIGVGYGENIDRVQAVITEVFETMRAEPTWAAQISNDLELWGLDQFGASSVDIVGRIKTPAGKQYGVRREFNRRIKIRFDAEGIELPYNYQKITIDPAEFRAAFGTPKTSPPAPTPGNG